ncbi:MAG: tetraacyldisaccharide 4'-kinase [Pseudomonadota bacterium]
MKPPRYWNRPPSALSRMLAPLGIYALGTRRRLAKSTPHTLSISVISIGNLNAGGTGKTPVAIALMEMITATGLKPHVVSRGYGGRLEGPHRVQDTDSPADVGDEPLLLAAFGPVWVAKDRATGGEAAQEAGADIVILDDGHQNPSLTKTVSIVVIDADIGFGNRNAMPVGPLRETVPEGLARADCVVLIGSPEACTACKNVTPELSKLPVFTGALTPLATGMPWSGMPVFAFAGIGRPEKMFATLRSLGADLRGTRAFDDHEPYAPMVLTRLEATAKDLGAQLVTTEKDAVRLPLSFRKKVLTLPVRLVFDDPAGFAEAINEKLNQPSS